MEYVLAHYGFSPSIDSLRYRKNSIAVHLQHVLSVYNTSFRKGAAVEFFSHRCRARRRYHLNANLRGLSRAIDFLAYIMDYLNLQNFTAGDFILPSFYIVQARNLLVRPYMCEYVFI